MLAFTHCQVRDSRPYLLQMGFKRKGLSMMLVIILLHTCHFTELVLSVSTDFVSIKGLKDALSNIRKNIATFGKILETRTIKVTGLLSKWTVR